MYVGARPPPESGFNPSQELGGRRALPSDAYTSKRCLPLKEMAPTFLKKAFLSHEAKNTEARRQKACLFFKGHGIVLVCFLRLML